MASYTLNALVANGGAYCQPVERGGHIYSPSYTGGTSGGFVQKISIATGLLVSTIDLGINSNSGGAFSLSLDNNSDIVVTNQDGTANGAGGSIQKINSSDTVSLFVSSATLVALAVSAFRTFNTFFCNGNYYTFGNEAGVGATRLYKTTPGGTVTNVSVTDIKTVVSGVVLGTDIYVVSQSQAGIYKLDCTTDTLSTLNAGATADGQLSIHPTYGLYYLKSGVGSDVNMSTGALTNVDTWSPSSNFYHLWARDNSIYANLVSTGVQKSTTAYATQKNLSAMGVGA